MIAREYTKFISEFVCHPKAVGTFTPSSSHLAKHVVKSIDWQSTTTIVEYGPGTGVVTEEILARMVPNTKFLAIEISSRFAELLRLRFPDVRICEGSAHLVQSHCAAHGVSEVDVIVSGLPWAAFSDDQQTSFLDATVQVLRPGGQFISFGHLQGLLLPAGRRFRRKLGRYFADVRISKPVWANLPPAFFYTCRR